MADKKYQVFISSTFKDLVAERQMILKGILDLDHIPSGMELFPAADEDQFEYIKQVIDECDYYVLIVGARYGAVNDEGVSYTEREYDYAVETGKNVIALIHGALDEIAAGKTEKDVTLAEKLLRFRERISTGRLVSFWTSSETLQLAFMKSFVHAMRRYPGVGWVRANTIANANALAQIDALKLENAKLIARHNDLQAQLRPALADIADLDDVFKIRYIWTEFYSGGVNKRSSSIELSWRDIFRGIAFQLNKPTGSAMIGTYIDAYIRTEYNVRSNIDVNILDTAQIKTQLNVLGLIKLFVSNSTKGGTDEFMDLTARGKQLKVELMAVRKK